MTFLKRSNNGVFLVIGFVVTISAILFDSGSVAFAQQSGEALDRRVTTLEDYVQTIQPSMVELSNGLNKNFEQYTDSLESSLDAYSKKLQRNLDQSLEKLDRKSVLLNPYSNDYQSIETNTGVFLIAVDSLQQIEGGGVRLNINIGNPNFADYQGAKFKFIWGQKHQGEFGVSYEEWQQSLKGVAFTFNGTIKKGMWNKMAFDLTPVDQGELGYLECEMEVLAIELGINQD